MCILFKIWKRDPCVVFNPQDFFYISFVMGTCYLSIAILQNRIAILDSWKWHVLSRRVVIFSISILPSWEERNVSATKLSVCLHFFRCWAHWFMPLKNIFYLYVFSVSRSREPTKDGVIATFDEHEDSVYAVEWSTADPWVFASLSYDGRLVINRVPRAEKYKILL